MPEPVAPRDPAAVWWVLGTVAATALAIVGFHYWAKPYLDVESEGEVQIRPEQAPQVTEMVSKERLEETVRAMAAFGSRLSGSDGSDGAADYIAARLKEILGAGNVREESEEVDNPFDLGTRMQAGGASFRVHPFWAPVSGTYRLPKGGLDLGPVVQASFSELVAAAGRLKGAAVTLPLPGDAEWRKLVLAAWRGGALKVDPKRAAEEEGGRFAAWKGGVVKGKLKNPITPDERALMDNPPKGRDLTGDEKRILDLVLEKHPVRIADFFFERIVRSGAKSILFIEPGTDPPYRVAPRSFDNRVLMREARVPRYLVPHRNAGSLSAGTPVRVVQALAALTLRETGESVRIYPMWPNLMRTASTPRDGLSGHLVWGGRGSLDEVRGKKVDGAVAMVDFNCSYQWAGLADFGARAVLFLEPKDILRGESESKYLSLPADVPRYWVPYEHGLRLRSLEGKAVKIEAQVVWEKRKARTVIGRLAGTKKGAADEPPVIIQAYYDSVSVVPEIAPGGEQACGVAAMLELARVLKRYPLKKDVLFVVNPGHAQVMKGWTDFLHRHYVELAEKNKKKKVDPGFIKPAFVVHLDLTTRTRRLGVFYKGHLLNHNEQSIRRVYSTFGKIHAAAGTAAAKALGYGENFMVDAINAVSGRTWDSYIPGRFTTAQEVTLNAGLYGVAYMTPDDERAWVDTPQDLPDRMDFESLLRQTRVLAATLPNVLNVGAAFGSARVTNYWTSLKGRVLEFDPRVDFLPNRTVSGAMVYVHRWVPNKSLKGVRGDFMVMAKSDDDEGGALFEIHGLGNSNWLASQWMAHAMCEAYEMDPMDGAVRYAPDRGPQGIQAYTNETDMNAAVKDLMLVVFPCRSLLLFDLVDPLQYQVFSWMTVLDAHTDSAPPVYGACMPEQPWYVPYVEPLAIGFARDGEDVKFTMSLRALGKTSRRVALVNPTDEFPEGIGYPIGGKVDRMKFTAMNIASDMFALNKYRLAKLKKHGIVNNYIEEINGLTTGRLEAARKALAKLDYRKAAAEARAAWGLAARVYPEVESMAVDVIHSAVLFLALLIPFAFLAERLLIAFPDVTRQVGGVLGIFLAMFLALRQVHPAFQIALTPLMILLAFVLIALSVIVSSMVLSRFFNFMREQKQSVQGVHEAEVSQISVGLAAFSIGVSNMRKRVLRTALTCITLVALTFAVLSLTSVLTAMKQRKFSIGKPAPYAGLLFRSPRWGFLTEPALRHLEEELGGIATPVPRSWFVSNQADRQFAVEITHGDKARATAVAALGMTSGERGVSRADRTVVAGEWLRPGETRGVLLPEKLAATLFIGSGDVGKAEVVIFGIPFVVRGLFDPQKFGKIRDLDDEEMSPVNFEATEKRRKSENVVLYEEGMLPERYDHHDPSQLVIMPHEELMRLGGRLASIAVPLERKSDLDNVIGSLLSRLGLLVYVGKDRKTFAYSAISDTATGGMDFLIVPVLVAALIVFSTMLGAVQERTREIGVFSSVGLAPNHVAILFFAEACVYAILGTVVGYLLGQAFSHLVVQGLVFKGLNVNYSSNATVLSVVVVMVVVLLSTIYPAHLASKLARPSQVSGFELPPLVGDQVRLELPFSFNARDAQAICAFLAEHFDAHAEASAGGFSAGDIRLGKTGDRAQAVWELKVRVWLAPYDFGVSQDLSFRTREGIGDESSADLIITRLSGDQASWRRVNGRFLKGIRKQFLIWRSLGDQSRARYQRAAAAMLGKRA